MVITAVAAVAISPDDVPSTGTLRGDVHALLCTMRRQLPHPLVARVVPDLLAESARHSSFGAAVHARIGIARRDRVRPILERAAAHGELDPDVDEGLCLDLLAAPLYRRLAVTREPFDDAALDGLVDVLVAAMRAA